MELSCLESKDDIPVHVCVLELPPWLAVYFLLTEPILRRLAPTIQGWTYGEERT